MRPREAVGRGRGRSLKKSATVTYRPVDSPECLPCDACSPFKEYTDPRQRKRPDYRPGPMETSKIKSKHHYRRSNLTRAHPYQPVSAVGSCQRASSCCTTADHVSMCSTLEQNILFPSVSPSLSLFLPPPARIVVTTGRFVSFPS